MWKDGCQDSVWERGYSTDKAKVQESDSFTQKVN